MLQIRCVLPWLRLVFLLILTATHVTYVDSAVSFAVSSACCSERFFLATESNDQTNHSLLPSSQPLLWMLMAHLNATRSFLQQNLTNKAFSTKERKRFELAGDDLQNMVFFNMISVASRKIRQISVKVRLIGRVERRILHWSEELGSWV